MGRPWDGALMSKSTVKKSKDDLIQVIGVDDKTAKRLEDAILARTMRELGIFLEEESKLAKRSKIKKEGK